eukprot:6181188-Pleurochrysis_carterae.AAC.1
MVHEGLVNFATLNTTFLHELTQRSFDVLGVNPVNDVEEALTLCARTSWDWYTVLITDHDVSSPPPSFSPPTLIPFSDASNDTISLQEILSFPRHSDVLDSV